MKNTLKTLFALLVVSVLMPSMPLGIQAQTAAAQTTTTQTTLSAAVSSASSLNIPLTSTTGITASSQTGDTFLAIDGELMKVQTVNTSGNIATVTRGVGGRATAHASGAPVYFGPAGDTPFVRQDPVSGATCTATAYKYLPIINVNPTGGNGAATARVWNCINSRWMRDDGYVVIGPGNCTSAVSGNSTGTNGLTQTGSVQVPTIQAQTSASGTNTHTYSCNLSAVTSRLNVRGVTLRDVVFLYGIQTTNLGTQSATLSSGTLNSTIVFTSVTYPTPGTSETPSSAAARADAGTLAITPSAANFNVSTTTAGQFYSQKFTPATPFNMTTDLKQFFFNVSLLNTATSATVTQSPGAILHYAYLPD